MLTLTDVDCMTAEYGEGWGYAHVRRVLRLAEIICVDVPHNPEVLTWAVYLHDWGAFKRYVQNDIPHALRSRQIVETEILPRATFSEDQQHRLIEAIEKHDYRDQRPVDSSEALLLREADWLDMLGAIGVVREFAWGPNNLRVCYDRVVQHRDAVKDRFTLPTAQIIAIQRIDEMNNVLRQISDDGFGFL